MDIRKYMMDLNSVVESSDNENDDQNGNVESNHILTHGDHNALFEQAVGSDSTDNMLSRVSQKEIQIFLEKVLENMDPTFDKWSHKLSTERYDWSKIKFKNFSAKQCQILWHDIQAHQRKFRTMRELVQDSIAWNKTKKSHKKLLHPDQPKKPVSAYLLYYQNEYKKMKEENPSIKCTHVAKVIAEKYKLLSPKKKARLNEKVSENVQLYETKMNQFKELHPEVSDSQTKPASKASASPKASITPFRLFCNDKLIETSHAKADHVKLKEEWSNLDPHQKALYIHQAKKEFMRVKDEPSSVQIAPTVTKDENKLYFKEFGVPVKPPVSGNSLFVQEYMVSEEAKYLLANERMKFAAQKWKELSEEERRKFNEQAKEKQNQYTMEYGALIQKMTSDELTNFNKYQILPDSIVYQVKIEEEEAAPADDFPKSAREYYKKKVGDSGKWKHLDQTEKEKWKKKFEKRKRKHDASISDTAIENESEIHMSPLYESTPNPAFTKNRRL